VSQPGETLGLSLPVGEPRSRSPGLIAIMVTRPKKRKESKESKKRVVTCHVAKLMLNRGDLGLLLTSFSNGL